jgi:DNA-binding CsgD family transcriptional regulator
VSRNHAKIMVKDNELYILDTDSTNGTLVNNKKITSETILKNNYIIQFSEYEFKVIKSDNASDILFNETVLVKHTRQSTKFVQRFNLTKKEAEILTYLLEGTATKDIANFLSISSGTAKNHILNIYKKTDTHSKFELFNLYKKIEDSK